MQQQVLSALCTCIDRATNVNLVGVRSIVERIETLEAFYCTKLCSEKRQVLLPTIEDTMTNICKNEIVYNSMASKSKSLITKTINY